MLGPLTLPLFVRHLDAIDEALAARIATPHWKEAGLTSLLCDLLDENGQRGYSLSYGLEDLRADLSALAPLLTSSVSITTHDYNSYMERWVTQSDLGLVVRYMDEVLPELDRTCYLLLQAKRLYPNPDGGAFDENCSFLGLNKDQEARITQLRAILGQHSVQHLLYCPRESGLDENTRLRLSHLRERSLDAEIFDYVVGLTKFDVLRRQHDWLNAGIFVTPTLEPTTTLREVHQNLFRPFWPFAWFLPRLLQQHYAWEDRDVVSAGQHVTDLRQELLAGLVTGNPTIIDALRDRLDLGDRDFRIMPAHTLTIGITVRGRSENSA